MKISKKSKKIFYSILTLVIVLIILSFLNWLKGYTPHFSDSSWEVTQGKNDRIQVYEETGTSGSVVFIHAYTMNYKGDPNIKTTDSEFFQVLEATKVKGTTNYTVYELEGDINPDCIGIYKNGQYQPHSVVVQGFFQPSDTYMCGHFDFEALQL